VGTTTIRYTPQPGTAGEVHIVTQRVTDPSGKSSDSIIRVAVT